MCRSDLLKSGKCTSKRCWLGLRATPRRLKILKRICWLLCSTPRPRWITTMLCRSITIWPQRSNNRQGGEIAKPVTAALFRTFIKLYSSGISIFSRLANSFSISLTVSFVAICSLVLYKLVNASCD